MIDLHVGPDVHSRSRPTTSTNTRCIPEVYEIVAGAANWVNKVRDVGEQGVGGGTTRGPDARISSRCTCDVRAGVGETSLFIRPPMDFKIVNALDHELHLPAIDPADARLRVRDMSG